jgi:protein-S-isoprenylcysteine O-methyltransferase Ste14
MPYLFQHFSWSPNLVKWFNYVEMESTLRWDNPAVRIGRWWFKNRSFSPIPFFLLLIILAPNVVWPLSVSLLLGVLVLLSEAIRVWAVGFAGSSTRTRGDKVPELVHVGPYLILRNPLYLANIGLYTFCGLFFGFTYLSVAFFFYSCIQYAFIIRYEEEVLTATFGEKYQLYSQSVPRWGLGKKHQFPPSAHYFSLSKALKSEKSTFYVLLALSVLYALKSHFQWYL